MTQELGSVRMVITFSDGTSFSVDSLLTPGSPDPIKGIDRVAGFMRMKCLHDQEEAAGGSV